MEEAPEGTEEESNEGGLNVEVLRSYAAFAQRAIKKSKVLIACTMVVGIALTIAIAKYLPRTYSCQTVLMTVANGVLDSDRGPQPFAGAEGLIMSHENLEGLIDATNLKQKYFVRRAPLLKLKDRIIGALLGQMNDKVFTQVLVGTLESKISVKVERETLTIGVDWGDGATAAELTQAAKDRFLEVRHRAEISAFQEKMAILDAHAASLREEIDSLADQIKENLRAKAEERKAEARKAGATGNATKPALTERLISVRSRPASDDQLPELRERLTGLRHKLSAAENDRNARIREQQTKLDELQLRLTPNHPQVITQQERVGMVSQVSSELAQMRSEVADLESQIRQREAMSRTGKSTMERVAAGEAPTAELLPPDVLGLLDEKDADPALAAQMSGAVVRYGSLRDDVRGAKLALDTAQAAFNHRYQVVIPVDEPSKPTKPKVPMIFGAGLALSLIVSLLIPILRELRRDVLVERWQVQHFQLPVLAELRLPAKGNGD